MSLNCQSCLPVECLDNIANLPDLSLYNLNEGQMFFNDRFCFVMNCPPGYRCTGPYPRTICIDPGTLPPIVLNPSGQASIICCKQPLFAQVPEGATPQQIADIVRGLQLQCAQQQAMCINIGTGPGANPPPVPNPGTGSTSGPLRFIGDLGFACVGSAYSSTIRVAGGGGSILFGMVSGHIPPGLSPQTGTDGQSFILSGTPSQAGTFSFVLSAMDGGGVSTNKSFSITIGGITSFGSIPPAVENTAYSYQLNATGGRAPYVYTLIGGHIPGITLSSSGLLSGTPDYATAGDYPITVQVSDSFGFSCTGTEIFRINLRPGPDWTKLTWPTYTLNQGGASSNCSGGAVANVASGSIHWAGNLPFAGVFPVQSGQFVYEGPSVTSIIRITATVNPTFGSVLTMASEIQINGAPSGLGVATGITSGTHDFAVVIPICGPGTLLSIYDIGGGNQWATCSGVGATNDVTFTWTIFNQ